jgi:uncharacterized membrane protein
MNGSLGVAAGLGAVTGLRSMQAVAWVARELSDRRSRFRRPPRLEAWLGQDAVAGVLGVMAAGELLADKLPGLPARVQPGPLFGRQAIGALVGAVAAGEDARWAGALVGAGAALVATYVGWFLRREVVRATGLPDAAVALVEDSIAVSAARELVAEL